MAGVLRQGRVTPFVDMRIVDDKGNVLPHDGKAYGDLQVRGPHVIQRYFKVCLVLCLACTPPVQSTGDAWW